MADNFPSLSKSPDFPLKESIIDSVIREQPEAGPAHARQRFTRYRRKFYLTYSNLKSNDIDLLMTHQTTGTSGTAESFTWTHPKTSTVYTVRYEAPFEISVDAYGDTWLGSCSFVLVEI